MNEEIAVAITRGVNLGKPFYKFEKAPGVTEDQMILTCENMITNLKVMKDKRVIDTAKEASEQKFTDQHMSIIYSDDE